MHSRGGCCGRPSGPSSARRCSSLASTTTRRLTLPPSRRARAEAPDAEQTAVEPYRLTPKLARRVARLGGLVVIGFAALVGRPRALHVVAGPHDAGRAQATRVR